MPTFDAIIKKQLKQKDDVIEQQAKELEALRKFANAAYLQLNESDYFIVLLLNTGLIDKNGNPTPLLTGKKED